MTRWLNKAHFLSFLTHALLSITITICTCTVYIYNIIGIDEIIYLKNDDNLVFGNSHFYKLAYKY